MIFSRRARSQNNLLRDQNENQHEEMRQLKNEIKYQKEEIQQNLEYLREKEFNFINLTLNASNKYQILIFFTNKNITCIL